MIKLKNNINQKINLVGSVEVLFYSFPLSFILGNLALSINLSLFIITGTFLIIKNELSIRFKNLYWSQCY